MCCAFTADGKSILSASTDGMAVMWDSVSKKEICSFSCLGRITCLDPSPMGSCFAVGDGSGILYHLQLVSGAVYDEAERKDKDIE